MSNYSKGERNEREAVNVLQQVYGSSTVDSIDRYGNNDPFRIVDIMAMKQDEKILFVQVKTNLFSAQDKRKYKRVVKLKLPKEHARFEVWVRIDRQGWTIYEYLPKTNEFVQKLQMNSCDVSKTADKYKELM